MKALLIVIVFGLLGFSYAFFDGPSSKPTDQGMGRSRPILLTVTI